MFPFWEATIANAFRFKTDKKQYFRLYHGEKINWLWSYASDLAVKALVRKATKYGG